MDGETTVIKLNEIVAVEGGGIGPGKVRFPWNLADDSKMLLRVKNYGASNLPLTVSAGNGLQGVSDYKTTIKANSEYFGVFESGAFMSVKGENAGYLVVELNSSAEADAFALP